MSSFVSINADNRCGVGVLTLVLATDFDCVENFGGDEEGDTLMGGTARDEDKLEAFFVPSAASDL